MAHKSQSSRYDVAASNNIQVSGAKVLLYIAPYTDKCLTNTDHYF